MKICFVMGTRPELIKLGLLVKRVKSMNVDTYVVHSGQHHDHEMSQVFVEETGIKPDIFLGVREETHGKQLSKIISRLEPVLLREKPDFCVVDGDTNTTVAGAVVAAKDNIKVAHVEAGCRCFMRTQEEINRIIIDDVADVLFAPSEYAVENLKREGVRGAIHNVGHIFFEIIESLKEEGLVGRKPELDEPSEYVLVTCHRSENVDNPSILKNIINGLTGLNTAIIFPIHPRTKKMLKQYKSLQKKLVSSHPIHVVPPVGHVEFLNLLADAAVVITDSGGVQVEASILEVPCATIREQTEWMETVQSGFNFLVGTDPEAIKSTVKNLLKSNYKGALKKRRTPFKGEKASEEMINILLKKESLYK